MKRFSIRSLLGYIIPAAIFTALIVWICVALGNASEASGRGQLNAVKNTIENGITLCYAIEGIYPPSAEYLSENYGVTYDREKYIVHYDCFADNVRPTVTVLERQAPK